MKIRQTINELLSALGGQRRRRSVNAWAGLMTLAIVVLPGTTMGSGHDTYLGDTFIYTADPVPPNILLLVDNSGSMNDRAYQAGFSTTATYLGVFDETECYQYSGGTFQPNPDPSQLKPCAAPYEWDGNLLNYGSMRRIDIVKVVMVGGICTSPRDASGTCTVLQIRGQNSFSGTACCLDQTQSVTKTQATGRMPASLLTGIAAAGNVYFHSVGSTAALRGSFCVDNEGTRTTASCTDGDAYVENQFQIRANVTSSPTGVLQQVGTRARFGLMEFRGAGEGGNILAYVGDPLQTIINAVESTVPSTWTPLAESLYEATRYFAQIAPASTFPSASYLTGTNYDPYYFRAPWLSTPGYVTCCRSSVIVFTDGESTQDLAIPAGLQDFAHAVHGVHCTAGTSGATCTPHKTNYPNNGTHYLDDVAYYAHITDLRASPLPVLGGGNDLAGMQNLTIYPFYAFGGPGIGRDILQAAAKAGGFTDLDGNNLPNLTAEWDRLNNTTGAPGSDGVPDTYFESSSADELKERMLAVISRILEVDTSFVAPVVPVSPENRTFSGSRVYLGFFKPIAGTAFWQGNLKKYGFSSGAVVDKNNAAATNPDGTFLPTAVSYWTTLADGGFVDRGGAGEALLTRATPRNIYTYMTAAAIPNLTNAANSFTTGNVTITPATLGVATSADKDRLINFIHGQDQDDADSDGNTTEKRSWILGDILHSKPVVVNYTSYSPTSETNCALNKTRIFVGGNDGMLHAFQDCDGSEAWSFIPPDLLSRLQYLTQPTRAYYVDGSPVVYTFDRNNDATINPADGDKVVLIFGERRGGGFYYALDVSDPDTPSYLWRRSAATDPASFGEMGQSWSDPKLVKVKDGANGKIVAIVGAGYDNANEDGRYGATQTFTGTGITSGSGEGAVTSTGAAGPLAPKGRGIYVMEVATLDAAGVPSIGTGAKVWGFGYGAVPTATTDPAMTFSLPSSISALDRNTDGYTDRFYVGDTGGNMWRFDIGDPSTTNWSGRKIFSSNPGSGGATDRGRKIFYEPSITIESGHEALFFGTGDREHPLNTAVLDRLYLVKDKGDGALVTESSNLVDVTTNALQESSDQSVIDNILSALGTQYGWFIKLDLYIGEKVLAPALVFREAYFTTYTPDASAAPDPCAPGNLGVARVYVLKPKTGEAAINLDPGNDGSYGTETNTRARGKDNAVLKRSDRTEQIRSGIPSGVVLVITPEGDLTALVGCGGALCTPPPPAGGNTFQLFWRRVL